jgi:integrase
LDTDLTGSLPLQVKVELRGLDFKGLVQVIGKAATAARGELLGWTVRAIERRAMEARPGRWMNRGQLTRRVPVSRGTVPIRRTPVRDRIREATYNLGDRLRHRRPYPPAADRSVEAVRTACELATSLSYRAARHWCARLVLSLEGWAAG